MLDATFFHTCFLKCVDSLRNQLDLNMISLDEKIVRRSQDRKQDKGPMHLASACTTESSMMLVQLKTSEKSDEITAIPDLLDHYVIKGFVVTMDAMGFQKEIAEKEKIT